VAANVSIGRSDVLSPRRPSTEANESAIISLRSKFLFFSFFLVLVFEKTRKKANRPFAKPGVLAIPHYRAAPSQRSKAHRKVWRQRSTVRNATPPSLLSDAFPFLRARLHLHERSERGFIFFFPSSFLDFAKKSFCFQFGRTAKASQGGVGTRKATTTRAVFASPLTLQLLRLLLCVVFRACVCSSSAAAKNKNLTIPACPPPLSPSNRQI
jgi:hypothetical protein